METTKAVPIFVEVDGDDTLFSGGNESAMEFIELANENGEVPIKLLQWLKENGVQLQVQRRVLSAPAPL